MTRYLFRRPRFPLICDAGSVLIGASSLEELEQGLAGLELAGASQLPIADASGEGWVFDSGYQVVSPLTLKKRWTKREIIAIFNDSNAARALGRRYSERSLSAKRFDRIMSQIVALLAAAKGASAAAGHSRPLGQGSARMPNAARQHRASLRARSE